MENPFKKKRLPPIKNIDRLILIAAPSGSGKTSLLKTPEKYLSLNDIPSEIKNFNISEQKNKHSTEQGLEFNQLCLHVDLTQPFRLLEHYPRNRKQIKEIICPSLYTSFHELQHYLKYANSVVAITLYINREEHFSRWCERGLSNTPNGTFKKIVTAINGDSSNRSELHRNVYRSWLNYLDMLNPSSSYYIDINHVPYQFITVNEFKTLID